MQRFNSMKALFHGLGDGRTRNQSRRRRMPQVEGLESRVVLSTVPLAVYGTGVSKGGTLLSTTTPSVDPHYTLVKPPNPYIPSAGATGNSYVVIKGAAPLADGAYAANGPNSEWISPDRSGKADPNGPTGYYDYRTTFDLTGDDPATAMLTGKWAVDNEGTILLNGSKVTSAGGTISTNTSASFHTLHDFAITATGSGVTFKPGVNTLDFIVHNDGALHGTARPPERDRHSARPPGVRHRREHERNAVVYGPSFDHADRPALQAGQAPKPLHPQRRRDWQRLCDQHPRLHS